MFSTTAVLSLLSISLVLAQSSYTPLPLQQQADNSIDKIESNPAPYSNYVEHSNTGLEGYTVQTGYEGYLIPYEDIEPALSLLETKGFLAAGLKLVHTVPRLALKVIFKAVPHVLFIGAVVLIGAAMTSTVCSLTSLCSAAYLPHWIHKIDKEQVRSLSALVNEDRLNAASHYVKTAIDNYYKSYGLKKTARSKKQ
ncbi:hypothetical protein M8J76_002020 [Diaphorina citri]|nr:hypothetical protein M8J75_011486 [Diaphorina citri]KAI5744407.1 hypothetical protein M8J76_002020 [Diaphorina citri]